MAKKKQQFLESKGGWIGAIILSIISWYSTINYGFENNIIMRPLLFFSFLNFTIEDLDKFLPFVMFFATIFPLILGFLIGYFIEKWFFKRRR